ncbi:MAG: PAS domain S-box protein [Candidatus Aminicenantes bacterium]|jgi:PAS domain S-box-containing protein
MAGKKDIKSDFQDELIALRKKVVELENALVASQKKQEELRRSEEKYRAIFESFYDVYYRTDRDGKIVDISPSIHSQAGYDPNEVIGHPVTVFFVEPAARDAFITRIKETGWINDYELKLKGKDGNPIETSVSARIILDENRVPAGIEGILRNISERKRIELALKDSEQKYRDLVDNALVGVYRTNLSGDILFVNEALAKLLGFSTPEEVKKESALVRYKDAHIRETFINELTEKGKLNDYEIELLSKSGEIKNVLISASLVGEEILGMMMDITERKKATEKIKAALKEKEVLLQELHHRVKNNMQVISGLIELQSQQLDDEGAREIFNETRDRVSSMALIHENLYKASDLGNINFAEYVKTLTKHLFLSYNVDFDIIQLKIEVEDVFLDVQVGIPCGLIVNELVSNTLKHAFPEGRQGEVGISLFAGDDGRYRLTVRDDGTGFPKGIDFRKTKSLGMQLVTMLVEQLEGTIELERKDGTKFIISFPEKKGG